MKRKIEEFLKEWKNSDVKKCLLIKGQRQIGKTYTIRKFANENYEQFVEINFEQTKTANEIFEKDIDVDNIIKQLTAFTGKNIIPGKTLIFFDEIQKCNRARTSLKYFTQDKRFDVIASGSLLGLTFDKDMVENVPVGYEIIKKMYPMDFEEFLWANGINEKIIEDIFQDILNFKHIPTASHNKFIDF